MVHQRDQEAAAQGPPEGRGGAGALVDRIRGELERQGITLRELARRSGVHHSMLSRLLRGQLPPTPGILGRLAPVLGTGPHTLYREAGLREPVPLEDTLRSIGLGDALSEEELSRELARLVQQASTPAGQARIRREFPHKRQETAMRGPLLDTVDLLYARYAAGDLPPSLQAEVGAALLYFIAPHDVIPDDHFPLGYVDDALVIQRVWEMLGAHRDSGAAISDGP